MCKIMPMIKAYLHRRRVLKQLNQHLQNQRLDLALSSCQTLYIQTTNGSTGLVNKEDSTAQHLTGKLRFPIGPAKDQQWDVSGEYLGLKRGKEYDIVKITGYV